MCNQHFDLLLYLDLCQAVKFWRSPPKFKVLCSAETPLLWFRIVSLIINEQSTEFRFVLPAGFRFFLHRTASQHHKQKIRGQLISGAIHFAAVALFALSASREKKEKRNFPADYRPSPTFENRSPKIKLTRVSNCSLQLQHWH